MFSTGWGLPGKMAPNWEREGRHGYQLGGSGTGCQGRPLPVCLLGWDQRSPQPKEGGVKAWETAGSEETPQG